MEDFQLFNNDGETDTRRLVIAKKFFKDCPTGYVLTGIWTEPEWNKEQFQVWFMGCLLVKTGGSFLTERDWNYIKDSRIISDYNKGVKRSGMNLLSVKKLQRKYPHINCRSINE